MSAAISNVLLDQSTDLLPGFNLTIPTQLRGIHAKILDPRKAWQDQAAYQKKSSALITHFIENFKQFDVSDTIKNAGPTQL